MSVERLTQAKSTCIKILPPGGLPSLLRTGRKITAFQGIYRAVLLALMGASTAVVWGCGDDDDAAASTPSENDNTVVDLSIESIGPETIVDGSVLVLKGGPFYPKERGQTKVYFTGNYDDKKLEFDLDATFEQYDQLTVKWSNKTVFSGAKVADSGALSGEWFVETTDDEGIVHRSKPVSKSLRLEKVLTPAIDSIESNVLFVNDLITINGKNFLLGGNEGVTTVHFDGCFKAVDSAECKPVDPVSINAFGEISAERSLLYVPFSPDIAGIFEGDFTGNITVENKQTNQDSTKSKTVPFTASIVAPALFSLSPNEASLGQFVDINGAGFVGPTDKDSSATTTVLLDGTFLASGAQEALPVQFELVSEYSQGTKLRYVLNEEDELGKLADLRTVTGAFSGTATPTITYNGFSVVGSSANVEFRVAPLKQVVVVRFLSSYVESLRHLGVRAADSLIRQRVLDGLKRDYAGINIEFRTEEPTDFALFSTLEISGPDPNGAGLLGYDNTPGKDKNNIRLYDRIGGVNAQTQLDGYPGFGGVFVESLFAYSKHPGEFAESIEQSDAAFDLLFDPFRPDQNGSPVSAEDLVDFKALKSGNSCPAKDSRKALVQCVVWVMGSLISSTASHELAHSLGLADPNGEDFHNPGDKPNRLMDSGQARSFRERAEISSEGPGVFCSDDYAYLRSILPTQDADPVEQRPTCDLENLGSLGLGAKTCLRC